ncbi:MAG: phosphate ABC transporter substrate-binding protein PstS [Candidatus Korarchaeota archaeon]|nr:phosphate ABC transporter substrate-binding protein PstS [Candidatus Korarchaeota archaeon]
MELRISAPLLASMGPLIFTLWVILGLMGTTVQGNSAEVSILGSGSSFIYPQMSIWIPKFTEEHPWVTLNYNPTGSGTGQKQFLSKLVDFAASDPPLTREVWLRYRGRVLQMPVVLGAVVITYNLPVEGQLQLDGKVLARIYRGEVRYWDDPLIKELNPTMKLPHREIVAVHRSDSSGTTNIFTFFLHKASPRDWPLDLVGKSVEWPVDSKGNGVGAKGNQGVTQVVMNTPYSLGYVELSYALENDLPMASVMNAEGNFVAPSTQSITEAARRVFPLLPKSPLDDFSLDLDAVVYSPGEGSYPLTSFVHLIFWTHYGEKAEAIREFVRFVNTEGQELIAEGYAPIPPELRSVNLKAVGLIKP